MGVQRLLKLRMASHSCSRPAVAPAARPLSSLLLAPSPAASAPRPAPLSCAAGPCRGHAAPGPARQRVAAGRRFPGVAAMSSSTPPPPGPVQKSEEEWQAILSPEQFQILRLKGTEYPGTGEYDLSFLARAFMNVLGVEPPYTNHLQSSTLDVVGQHFMREFLGL